MMKGSWKSACGRTMFALLAVSASGLAIAQDVTYNAMPGTDYSKYKTFKWVAIPNSEQPDQIVDQQIKQTIDGELAGKGFTKTDADTADMYVGYQVSLNQEKQWNAYGGGMGWRMGGGMGTATSSTINVGTLGFDVYDAKAKALIWRGSATKTLDAKPSPDKRQKNLDKAVAKLLKEFPPTPKK
jgi:hypothetical protein